MEWLGVWTYNFGWSECQIRSPTFGATPSFSEFQGFSCKFRPLKILRNYFWTLEHGPSPALDKKIARPWVQIFYRMRFFGLQLEASCFTIEFLCLQLCFRARLLTLGVFGLQLKFFAYSGKVRFKAPQWTVSNEAFPPIWAHQTIAMAIASNFWSQIRLCKVFVEERTIFSKFHRKKPSQSLAFFRSQWTIAEHFAFFGHLFETKFSVPKEVVRKRSSITFSMFVPIPFWAKTKHC